LTSLEAIELGGQEMAIQAARHFRTLRLLGITVRKTMDTVIASSTALLSTSVCGRRCFGLVSRPFPLRWALSCQAPTQTPAHHPQIGQRKQRLQLRRVLGQAAVAHLHMTELALDDTEWVLHLGSDACLDALALIGQRIQGRPCPAACASPVAWPRANSHLLVCTRPESASTPM
jgi:hypothetical protein